MTEIIDVQTNVLKSKVTKLIAHTAKEKEQESDKHQNKREFIQKYGIEMHMPANYIYEGFTYKPNDKYVITAHCQILPSDVNYYDFDKLGTHEDPTNNDLQRESKGKQGELSFKVYAFTSGRYEEANIRHCSHDYQHKICFSDDKMRVAIYRQEKPKLFSKDTLSKYVIDIFDCSSIDFFLSTQNLTPKDPSRLATISGSDLNGGLSFQNCQIRFSNEYHYLYIIDAKKTLILYDLTSDKLTIDTPTIKQTIPSSYEFILNVSVNEEEVDDTIIAAKKSEFRNIEFFTLAFLKDLNSINTISSGSTNTQIEINKIKSKHCISSLRLVDFDISSAQLRFSNDHSSAIYCDKFQSILMELAQEGMPQHQRDINHLEGKETRFISKYGDSRFLIAIANTQDAAITIKHSSDITKTVKFYFRFSEGTVHIRDIYAHEKAIRVLVTRDDEEFVIYEFEDFKPKETYWQMFFESSNYVFEWPYLCYLRDQKHILIQNAFNPDKVFYIEMNHLAQNEVISNIFLSDTFQLYIMIEGSNDYKIYEKDLDRCQPYIFNLEEENFTNSDNSTDKKEIIPTKIIDSTVSTSLDKPVAVIISKGYIGSKSIYRFYVRSSSRKEVIQTNDERLIFFQCDFKIYSIIGDDIKIVDPGYKFRIVNTNLIAYNTVDQYNEKQNEIKMLILSHSDYRNIKLYEELDGKLTEFLVQENQLLVSIQLENSEHFLIKVFDYNAAFQLKLKYLIQSKDYNFLGSLQTVNYFQSSMIPAGNNVYTIVFNGVQPLIHSYKNVLPLEEEAGENMAFISPMLNYTYRKMIYFITNKKGVKPKKAIIMPYLVDNYTLFNKRFNLTQFCQFASYKDEISQENHTDILCLVPYTKFLYHYNFKGQLKSQMSVKNEFINYGEKNLAVSPNGSFFLQKEEDDYGFETLCIIKLHIPESVDSSKIQNKDASKQALKKPKSSNQAKVAFELTEKINLDEIKVFDHDLQKIGNQSLKTSISSFTKNCYEVICKMNDNLDIVIGFLDQKKHLKYLIFLKNMNECRVVYNVILKCEEKINQEVMKDDKNQNLLQGDNFSNNIENLQCVDFILTSEKLIIWSKHCIYHGDCQIINSNYQSISIKKSTFEIFNPNEDGKEISKGEAHIESITANGINSNLNHGKTEEQNNLNYYIYMKIVVENSYSFMMKYNIEKEKEFASFDCSLEAQFFFDSQYAAYIFDSDSIIDIDQGIPLYFYKTGIKDYKKGYLLGGTVDRGSRFCPENLHFMVRNRFYLPYSYFIYVLQDNQMGQSITLDNWDPEALYRLNGDTVLHQFANSYKELEFILNQFHQTKPALLNMLFLKNHKEKPQNVLEIAMEKGNTRCVKLILDSLSKISMNNIHALKQSFPDLLNYSGFDEYLRLCFFDTNQMKSKSIFSRIVTNSDEGLFIASHQTSFLDKKFYQTFEDKVQPSRQVIIRGLDAGWILKTEEGTRFQVQLSNQENMDYFQIDTIKLIINYQWNLLKPKIIGLLFIPFIINMIVYNFYAIESYERSLSEESNWLAINRAVQVTILLFSIQTAYVEFKQISFHQKEYIQSFWNVLDLATVILAPLTVIMDLSEANPQSIRPIMAVCAMIFFLRFFYFLRIFDASAHLVRTIVEITYDIRYFIFVFFLGIVGFGISFQILSNNNDSLLEGAQFIPGFWYSLIYSYRLSLGDFSLDAFDNSRDLVLIWTVFVVCSFFTAILLLNMLVAIMGDSFNRVMESSDSQSLREHLQLIVENDFLIDKAKTFQNVKFLIEIRDDAEQDDKNIVTKGLTNILQEFQKESLKINQNFSEIRELIKSQASQGNQMKKEINQIKKMLINQGVIERQLTFHSSNSEQNYASVISNI